MDPTSAPDLRCDTQLQGGFYAIKVRTAASPTIAPAPRALSLGTPTHGSSFATAQRGRTSNCNDVQYKIDE